ncbi:Ig-like domain-containing protein, partial [Emticicia fontis]
MKKLLIFLLFVSPSLFAQTFSTPVSVVTDAGFSIKNSHQIVNGKPAFVYRNANFDLMYVRANDAAGSSWGVPVTLETDTDADDTFELEIIDGNPAVVYSVGGVIKFKRAIDINGVSWNTAVRVSPNRSTGVYPTLSIINGKPGVAYRSGLDSLKFSIGTDAQGSSFNIPIAVVTIRAASYISLKEINGNPAISCYNGSVQDLLYIRATNATGTNWGSVQTIQSSGIVGAYNSLAIVNDRPAITYVSDNNTANDFEVRYIRANDVNGSSWGTSQTVYAVPGRNIGLFSSLAIVDNVPAIAFLDNTFRVLMYAKAQDANGDVWNTSVVVDNQNVTSSISLTAINNRASIIYRNGSNVAKYVLECLAPADPTSVSVNNASICTGNSVSLTANACASGTLTWYNQATGGTAIGTGSPLSQSPTVNTTYYASCKDGSCESSRASTGLVTVNSNPGAPTSPIATPATIVVSGITTLTASGCDSPSSITWYDTANSATALPNNTPTISSNKTFFARCTDTNTCVSTPSTTVSVTYCTPLSLSPGNVSITWTGAISTDWNTACNWNPAWVPDNTSGNVYIGIQSNQPVISGVVSTIGSRLYINAGAILTVNTGGVLTVGGVEGSSITLNGGAIINEGSITTNTTGTGISCAGSSSTSITNRGTINLNNTSSGLFTGGTTTILNESTGVINLTSPSGFASSFSSGILYITNHGTITCSGSGQFFSFNNGSTLTNDGTINITAGEGMINPINSSVTNNACGKIIMATGSYLNNGTTTNAGLFQMPHTYNFNNTGTFTNNGVLKANIVASITNNRMVITNACPIFTLGSSNNYTVSGIFTDDAASISAGNYTSAGNIFTANNSIPTGSQTLYAQVSDGTCTFIVPFTFNNLKPTSVAASLTTICSGNPVSLSANTCGSGLTITWYNQATGGTSIGTGSPLSKSPTINTTYYASCKSESCESSRVSTGLVTVNNNPLPPTSPMATPATIIVSGTTTLTASGCNSPSTITWFDTANSTVALPNNTPAISSNKTFFARCTDTNTCVSAPSTTVSVTYTTSCSQVATATETMTWTGTASTDWANACNWSPIGVPTATNPVIINDVTNDPVIVSGTVLAKTVRINGAGASLTINNGATLTISTDTGYPVAVDNGATLTNNGILNASYTNLNPGSFAVLTIDDNTTVHNYGTISLSAPNNYGLRTRSNAIFNNKTGATLTINAIVGIINESTGIFTNEPGAIINASATIAAIAFYSGQMNNYGLISLTGALDIAYTGTIFNNYACATVKITEPFISSTGTIVTNNGYMEIDGGWENYTNFTNNGVLKYGSLSNAGTLNNTTNASIIVNNSPKPIFTYGGTYDGTVNGIFTDATATTSAGTFTAPNTFIPTGLPNGSQTLYAKITQSGAACSYIVPFTYCNTTASISYSGTPYCKSASASNVTLTGASGGTFTSAPAGLAINPSSGQITPSSSTAGAYKVTYTIAASGGCAAAIATTSVTITNNPSATISYSGTPYCKSVSASNVTLTGTSGGTFTSAPAGLSLNASSGQITPGSSTAGSYTVTYTIASRVGCAAVTATTSVTINSNPGVPTSPMATPATIIVSGNTTLTASGCNSPSTITWYDTANSTVALPNNTPAISSNKTFFARCTDTNTCVSAPSTTVSVTYTTSCSQVATATETMTWTGTASTDWANACNWSPNGVPTATNPVIINDVTNDPVIVSGTALAKKVTVNGAGASITINNGATLTVSTDTDFCVSIENSATFINNGTLNASYTDESSLGVGALILGTNATVNNYGIISLTAPKNNGMRTYTNAIFTNKTGATLTINANTGISTQSTTFTNETGAVINGSGISSGISFNNGQMNNYGLVSMTGQMTVSSSGTIINNYACATLKMTGGFSAQSGITITNNGYIEFGGIFNNAAVLTNNGVLKYGSLNNTGTLNNTTNTSIIVNNASTPIFTYGGTYGGTVNGIFTDATATISAGTFTAPNTFIPTGLPNGSQTLYAKITPSGAACSYIVPFTYCNTTASINYSGTPYCKSASASNVTLTGTSGGTFTSAPAGLSLNASSGQITPGSSTAGTYTVTYTIAASGGCAAVTATTSVTITNNPSATISYSGTPYCKSASASNVTLTGTSGGAFTSAPAGLSLNASSGQITPGSSTAGTYTVTYTIAANGGCAALTATTSVTITNNPSATISYSGTPYCKSASASNVTLTGASGGTFTSAPAGLSLNASSGQITPGSSTAGTYTVTYTIAASGGCAAAIATTSVTITNNPSATISYSGTPYCKSANASNVTLTGINGGTFTSAPVGLTINPASGQITPGSSTAGTYTVTYNISASGGCAAVTTTTSVTINNNPSAPTINAPNPKVVCALGTLTLTASGCAGTINWSNGSSGSSLTLSSVGTYSISATCTVGSCISVASTAVTGLQIASQPSAPTITAPNPKIVCAPGTLTLTASGCAGTINWSSGSSGSSLTLS